MLSANKLQIFFVLNLLLSQQVMAQAIMFKIATGANEDINIHGVCRNVANATGKELIVPVRTVGEWSAFRASTITGVTLTNCDLCPGISTIGGTCPNGAKYAGTYDYGGSIGTKKLLIVPGACTDSATPACSGGTDTVTKTWESSPGQTTTGATSADDGYANTTTIIAAGGQAKPAASYCSNMTFGGLYEWYLPSLNEMTHLYTNRVALGTASLMSSYWSSTESAFNNARAKNMGDGTDVSQGKTNTNGVRCLLRY